MESVNWPRYAALTLSGALVLLLLLWFFRPAPTPRRQAAASPALAPPSPQDGPRRDPPARNPSSLTEPTDALGIRDILPRENRAASQSFSGDLLPPPASPAQAEAYLRRLSSMSRKLENSNSAGVPLGGETVPLLQKTPEGGSALGEPSPAAF